MKRIINMADITTMAGEKKEPVGNQLFEHGGYGQGEESEFLFKKEGYMFIPYHKGMTIKADDIVLFSDREHFYKGWRALMRQKVLKNTICLLIESVVWDKKCGKEDLCRIKNAFPAFLTYQDDLIDNYRFFKYCPSINSSTIMERKNTLFDKLELGVIVCTNMEPSWSCDNRQLYSEKRKMLRFFEDHKEYAFGLYGRGWDGWSNWKGVVKSKTEIYSKYKFAFCLENIRGNGYITEKIFDCFQKGIVPVYGGAYNVTEYIPSNCFIDYFAFDDMQQLVDYLNGITEETYNAYLEAIENFLKSEKFAYFRIERQIERVCEVIRVLPGEFKPDIQARINMFVFVHCYEIWRKSKQQILSVAYRLKSSIPILKNMQIIHRNN